MAERYRELADRLFHQHDLAVIDEVFAEDYEGEYGGQPIHGRAAFRASIEAMLAGLEDTRYVVHDTAETGDLLWAHWTCTGIHRGTLLGVPGTNTEVKIEGLTLNRFAHGRIVWGLVKWDRMTVAEQLRAAAR